MKLGVDIVCELPKCKLPSRAADCAIDLLMFTFLDSMRNEFMELISRFWESSSAKACGMLLSCIAGLSLHKIYVVASLVFVMKSSRSC